MLLYYNKYMNEFFKYANAAQRAIVTGVSSAHKEFFENLDSNSTKLTFVKEQNGGNRKKSNKKSNKKHKKSNKKHKKSNKKPNKKT